MADPRLLTSKVIESQLAHKDCYLEVLIDDMLYPAYSSAKIGSKHMKFDESVYLPLALCELELMDKRRVGDAFIRQLEFSKVTLPLREHGKDGDEEDEIFGRLIGGTLKTVKQCLVGSLPVSLDRSSVTNIEKIEQPNCPFSQGQRRRSQQGHDYFEACSDYDDS